MPLVACAEVFQFAFRIGLESFDTQPLLLAVHVVALPQHVEIHLAGVELRTVDAGELAAVVDQHTAAATHTRSVDHDRVQADDGLDLPWRRDVGARSHHRDRAAREHVVHRVFVNEFLQLLCDQTLLAGGAIVGHDVGSRR